MNKTIPLCNEVTYVLQCSDDIYYVGKSTQLNKRLTSHFSGKGSKVTQRHLPISIVKMVAGDVEKELTLYGREKYGTDKCYGYCYHEGS